MSIYAKDQHWSLYVGIMTESTSYRNQRKFNVYVSELAPFAEGDIQPELFENKVEIENVFTGQKEQSTVKTSKNVIADYFGVTSALDVPTMYKGQQVLVLNYGHNDRWYWLPLERDDHLKTFEHYRIHCNDQAVTNKVPDAQPEDLEKKFTGITDDNSYFFEIDTKYKKMIRFRTANTDGESFRYYFEVDAEANTIKLWDEASNPAERTTPNQITIESRQSEPPRMTGKPDKYQPPHGKITIQTADNCSIIMNNTDMDINVPRNLKITVGGQMMTSVTAGAIREVMGPCEERYNNTFRFNVVGDVAIHFMARLGLRIVGLIQSIFDTTFSASIGVPGFNYDEKTGPKPGNIQVNTVSNIVNTVTGNVSNTVNGNVVEVVTGTETRTINKLGTYIYKDSYAISVVNNMVQAFSRLWNTGLEWNIVYPKVNVLIGKIDVGVSVAPPIVIPTACAVSVKSEAPAKKDPSGTAKGDAPTATGPSEDALTITFVNGIKAEVGGGQEINVKGDAITIVEGVAQNDFKGAVVNNISGTEYNIITGDRLTDVEGRDIVNAYGLYELNAEGDVVYNFNKSFELNSVGESTLNFNDKLDISTFGATTLVADGTTDMTYNDNVSYTYNTDRTEIVEGTTTVEYKQDRIDTYDGNYEINVAGNHKLSVTGDMESNIEGNLDSTVVGNTKYTYKGNRELVIEGTDSLSATGAVEYTFDNTFTQIVNEDTTYTFNGNLTQTVEKDASFIHKALTTLTSNELVVNAAISAKLVTETFEVVATTVLDTAGGILNYLKGLTDPPWPPKTPTTGEDSGSEDSGSTDNQ